MDFGLSQEQVSLKDTVARFLAEQCPTTRVRQIMESENGYDPALQQGIAEIGVPALIVPDTYDGLGLELLDLALVAEEMGFAVAPGPFLGNALATIGLIEGGDEALKDRWLRTIASGEAIGTFALGEPESEWDPAKLKTKVSGGKLSGEKPLVLYADVADFMLVAACDDTGPGLWLVERDAPGIERTRLKCNDMTQRLLAVTFTNTPAVPLPNRAGLQRTIDAGLVLLAADAFGGCRRCLNLTVDYALQRTQFGQVIGAFQAVKHQLANMATDIEPSMALYWYAAHAYDRIKDQSSHRAAIAKAHMSDLYDKVTRDATELHGGIGFTWEFDLHLWFRRAMFNRGYLGDATHHRLRAADLAGW